MHSCSDLLVASTNFTEENFPDVVKGDEFLNLSFAEVCTLISSDQVIDSKVFSIQASFLFLMSRNFYFKIYGT